MTHTLRTFEETKAALERQRDSRSANDNAAKIKAACKKITTDDGSVLLVRGMLTKVKCIACKKDRWDDGKQCQYCGSSRHTAQRTSAVMDEEDALS